MERRVILAIALMMAVAFLPSLFFRPKPTTRRPAGQAPRDTAQAIVPAPAPAVRQPERPAAPPTDTIWVGSPLYRFGFSTVGADLVTAQLLAFQSFARRDSGKAVQLVPEGRPLLTHRLVIGADTVSLADWTFEASVPGLSVGERGATLSLHGFRRPIDVTLTYRFRPDSYVFDVEGEVTGLGPEGALLLVGLGAGLRSVQADSLDDYRRYALVTKAAQTERKDLRSFDAGERIELNGPFEWVGLKSKYFFTAVLALEVGQPRFGGVLGRAGERGGKRAPWTQVAVTLPVSQGGAFRYQVFTGPLEPRLLSRIGHGLDDANPYGWIFRPIIQPVSVWIVALLLWMHEQLSLAYGWVLIIFGLLVRIVLWPLNQKAMESSIRMQQVAPLLKNVQDRYKNDPERLQKEMMRLYREYKVNPFGGCLPMLLPLPFLLALFFVFDNTIEFRGVSFIWIPDLSRPDPLYIIPVLMGLSMFVLSKVGQKGVPPNPQAKMMLYFLPVMMTVLFLNFASGLNLYYAAQNLFSLPQQWLIARRRVQQTAGR